MWRIVRGRPRLFTGLACGLVVWPFLAGLPQVPRFIIAWDCTAAVFLALSGWYFFSDHVGRMEHDAESQEEGEWTLFAGMLVASGVSLVAIFSAFSDLSHMPPDTRGARVALVAVTLVLSWLMTQIIFAYRYAHEYYSRPRLGQDIVGGLVFPGTPRPDYLDFVYFALVLGMTFQVSDVAITASLMRRLAALHGLVGFVFNTVILALTINLAAGLLG